MNSTKNSEMQSLPPMIIAVDGYSSCGKSTFARMIAGDLNFVYIDSGAMYRAVTLYCLENKIIQGQTIDIKKLRQSLHLLEIRFHINSGTGIQETWLNGRNIENEIRGIEVSQMVSKISQIKEVRHSMVALQRFLGSKGNVVMDGRDIGSTVFPEATLKIFMTADARVRAERRYIELVDKGIPVEFNEIVQNIRMRDHEDETRQESPLRKAEDAVILDNSHMTVDEQMNWFRLLWKNIQTKHEN
jgi:cytidylate kinase